MPQFDVHRNPGQHRDAIPYVVVVQSAVFDAYRRRVVAPLMHKRERPAAANARFFPLFTIGGQQVFLNPLELTAVPADKLGNPVASLAARGEIVIAALDELLSRAHG